MARDHARIKTSILDDKEWTTLTSAQQMTYLSALCARDLSFCGVLPYIPSRFTMVATDISVHVARSCLQVLERKKFLVIDRDTAEILVRSYIRHDGILKQPNVAKACAKAFKSVYSPRIKEAIITELARLLTEDPSAKGWQGIEQVDSKLFEQIKAKGSPKG